MTGESEILIEAGHTERNYWRDVFVRYKQTVIGVLWAVLRPFLTMVVFVFIFSKIAKLPSEGMPYPVLVFAGMLPWQLFSTSLSEGSNSLADVIQTHKVKRLK
jgi:lipopolysaccharide transport system permease protein